MTPYKLFPLLPATLMLLNSMTATVSVLDPHRAITQYVHDVWQTKDGIPQNSVQVILQDRRGYLWQGTQEGLSRFDGVQFKTFDKWNTPGFTGAVPQAFRSHAYRMFDILKQSGKDNSVRIDTVCLGSLAGFYALQRRARSGAEISG